LWEKKNISFPIAPQLLKKNIKGRGVEALGLGKSGSTVNESVGRSWERFWYPRGN